MTTLVSCFNEGKKFVFSHRSLSFRNELFVFLDVPPQQFSVQGKVQAAGGKVFVL